VTLGERNASTGPLNAREDAAPDSDDPRYWSDDRLSLLVQAYISRLEAERDKLRARVAELEAARAEEARRRHRADVHDYSRKLDEARREHMQEAWRAEAAEDERYKLLEQRARILSLLESAADRYPEDVFPSPPPGEHGAVDCCSARAIRRFLAGLVAEVREMLVTGSCNERGLVGGA